jgi:hypothetical protein
LRSNGKSTNDVQKIVVYECDALASPPTIKLYEVLAECIKVDFAYTFGSD